MSQDELIKRALNSCEIKSQHELNTCNDGKRSSDVLLSTIEELERTKKQLENQKKEYCIAIDGLRTCLLNCRNYFMSNNLEYFVNQIDKALDMHRS